MKICLLNGSPKGKYSVTLHTALYLQKKFPDCELNIVNVGQKIRSYEKDFSEPKAAIEEAELILFSYPVYTFIAPYQLHRFIELLKESDVRLEGKYAAQITTSKHFYDVTAHEYIKQNCMDMRLKYIGGLSADMDDLLSDKGRGEAEDFFRYISFCVKEDIYERAPALKTAERAPYVRSLSEVQKREGNDTVLITDLAEGDASLAGMIDDFIAAYPYRVRVINVREFPFKGGCLGCFNCAVDGTCIYTDGFDRFLREEIQTAKAMVYAFTVKDHSMGASFKCYDDRQFCNGHRTVTMGVPVAYLVNGNLEDEPNLKRIIEGRCDVGRNFLAGCASDGAEIAKTAQKLSYALENNLTLPQTFYGVGGLKIFRDLIYLMRGMMKADHKFYKKNGFYDFPQKKKGTALKMKLVGLLLSNKKIKAKLGNSLNDGMISPYKKVLDAVDRGKL